MNASVSGASLGKVRKALPLIQPVLRQVISMP
jgi:hypothetical protein